MKIGIISSFDESLINFRLDLIKDLLSKKYEIYVVAPKFNKVNKLKLDELGVVTSTINFERTKINPFFEILTIIKLYIYFKKNNFDKLILYTVKPVIFGSIAAKMANIKSINSLITGLGHYFIAKDSKSLFIRKILIILYKFSLNFNSSIIFQNIDDKNYFIKKKIINENSNKLFVVNGSGVNTNYFKAIKLPKKITFVFISRLLKEKGVVEYIDACEFISNKYHNIHFLLGGWIDKHPDSININQIDKFKQIKNSTYLGKVYDVRDVLIDSSVLVLPSYREGLPRIVIEAMSCGRPIITTNVPGCRETVEEGKNGFLVDAKSFKSISDAMEKFINNSQLIDKMSVCSREIAVKKFEVKLINNIIINIIF